MSYEHDCNNKRIDMGRTEKWKLERTNITKKGSWKSYEKGRKRLYHLMKEV